MLFVFKGCAVFDLAQVFVDTGLVLPAESSGPPSCYSSTSIISDPYPRLVFCGTIKQVQNEEVVTDSVESSSVPHDQTHLDMDNCSSSHAPWTKWTNGEAGTVNGTQVESGSIPGGSVLSNSVLSSVPAVESLLNSTSGSMENGGSSVFRPDCWYRIPSPEEVVATIDSAQALSVGRVQELRQCLQFFATKRLKKGMILSVLESRKKRDTFARQFIVSLPREVVGKYPWMYVREQTVLACLGLRL